MSETKQCLGKKKDGGPCKADPTGSGYCPYHDPAISADTKSKLAKTGAKAAQYPLAVLSQKAELLAGIELPDLSDPNFLVTVALRVQAGTLPVSVAEMLRRLYDSRRADRELELEWAIFRRIEDPAFLAAYQAAKAKEAEKAAKVQGDE
jgi:hypothetical protein